MVDLVYARDLLKLLDAVRGLKHASDDLESVEDQAEATTHVSSYSNGKDRDWTMFLLAMVFLAAILAVLGVVFQDNWAKGGVAARGYHRNPALLEHNQGKEEPHSISSQDTRTRSSQPA